MEIDIQAVVPFQHQRRLEDQVSLRLCLITFVCKALEGKLLPEVADSGSGVGEFVGVIVSRHAEAEVITAKIEFSQFLFYLKDVQGRLLGKFITETESVIEKTEAYAENPSAAFLGECDEKFIVVVANLCIFAPYRIPVLVNMTLLRTLDGQGFDIASFIFQSESKAA